MMYIILSAILILVVIGFVLYKLFQLFNDLNNLWIKPNEEIDIGDLDYDLTKNSFFIDCFILKNTEYIRNELVKLGYRPSNTFSEKSPFIWAQSNGVFFDSRNLEMENIDIGGYTHPYGISCGDNDKLFLSIAALKENSDKYQWFISEFNREWYFCEDEQCAMRLISSDRWNKATVTDLINYFNKKTESN